MILILVLVGLLVGMGVLFWWSNGKPAPILDETGTPLAGSLSEKLWVTINGVEQGMFIQSAHPGNPVLLFVHGGPGMPEYFLTERHPTGLENDFTVVWWDQRGAGLSYRAGIPRRTMTVDQLVADAIEVTHYLRHRFGQEKIFLMGHSGGSFIALLAAAQAPELFYAYIAMAQVTHQLKSEKLAYDYMLTQYRRMGNTRMARRLEQAPPSKRVPLPAAYDALRDEAMHGLGIGTTRAMKSVITGVFIPSWLSRQLTLGEKVNLWRGKIYSKRCLRDTMFATDLTAQVPALNLPVFFFHGRYDYTCSYELALDYFEKLKAPDKAFFTFEDSAHTPIFEEPEKARRILREIAQKLLGGAGSAVG